MGDAAKPMICCSVKRAFFIVCRFRADSTRIWRNFRGQVTPESGAIQTEFGATLVDRGGLNPGGPSVRDEGEKVFLVLFLQKKNCFLPTRYFAKPPQFR
jgi:hypothetical protein